MFVLPVPPGMSAPKFADALRQAVPDLAQAGALAIDLAGQSEFGSLIGREGRTVRVEVCGASAEDAARAARQVRAATVAGHARSPTCAMRSPAPSR